MLDLFFFLMVFLILGVAWVIGAYVLGEVTDPLIPIFNGTAANTTINTVRTGYRTFDFIFGFLFIVLNLVPLYMAVMVKNHPVFFVVNLILFIIYMLLAPVISNVMLEVWSNPALAETSTGGSASVTLPMMTRLFQYLPLISFGLAFLVSIAMFGKGQGGGV